MIMKRGCALLLAGALFLSACGQSGQELATDGLTEEQSGEATIEETGGNQGQGDALEEAQLPFVAIETLRAERYAEDGETLLADVRMDSVALEGEGYEKASEAVKKLLYQDQAQVDAVADALADAAAEQYEEEKDLEYGWFGTYSSSGNYQISRFDANVLSLKESVYEFTGGAHGYGADVGVTFDLAEGTELSLPQLAKNPAGFMEQSVKVILEELSESEEELFDGYQEYIEDNLESTSWYLDAAGIEFAFSPYEIGPYAAGTITVCVPYASVAEYMKPEYASILGNGIAVLPKDRQIELQWEAGDVSSLMLESRPLDGYSVTAAIILDEQREEIGEDVYLAGGYFVRRAGGKAFVLFDFDWASNDYETDVYEITDGKLRKVDTVWAELIGKNMGPDRLKLLFRLDVFGTYYGSLDYRLTADGKLEALGERYEIASNPRWQSLTLIKELPVFVDGKESVLPVGTTLCIVGVDVNQNTVWFETTDGTGISGKIHYETREDEWSKYVNGVSETEYFESLPYSD